MSEYAGRNVLVTGAASGIGRLLALRMAGEGAHVILWDVNSRGIQDVQREIVAAGGPASAYGCNLADRREIAAGGAPALPGYRPLRILLDNARLRSGKAPPDPCR